MSCRTRPPAGESLNVPSDEVESLDESPRFLGGFLSSVRVSICHFVRESHSWSEHKVSRRARESCLNQFSRDKPRKPELSNRPRRESPERSVSKANPKHVDGEFKATRSPNTQTVLPSGMSVRGIQISMRPQALEQAPICVATTTIVGLTATRRGDIVTAKGDDA